jgi:cell division protein FtsQ
VRARRDAVPASTRRFTQRIRRRRVRAALPWLIALGLVTTLAGGAVTIAATPVLGVRDVRVTGNRLVTAAQVRAAARVAPGTPLVRVDAAAVRRRIGRLTAVATVTVTRGWPHTLVVRVVERNPVAAVAVRDRYAIVDRTGVVFDWASQRPAALPVLQVPTPGTGDPITHAALTVLGALPPGLRDPLVVIAADAPARIRLELRGGRQIIWGDATQNDAKVRVALALLNRNQPVMDVSAPSVIPTR